MRAATVLVLVLTFCSALLPSPAVAVGAGSALSFDGSNIAVIPDSPVLSFSASSTWTIELWMYRSSGTDVCHVFGKRGSCFSNPDMTLQLAGGVDYTVGCSYPGCGVELGAIPLGRWTHVAVTCDRVFMSGYVDGHLRDRKPVVPGAETNAPLVLGGSDGCGARFPGMLDELRVWSVARDSTSIQAQEHCSIAASTPGLVGYWRFDDAPCSQVIADQTSSQLHGTLGSTIGIDADDAVRIPSSAPITCSAASSDISYPSPIVEGYPTPADPGNALSFDGGEQLAAIPDASALRFASTDHWTMEFWIYRDSGTDVRHVFGKRGSCFNNSDMTLQMAGGVTYSAGWSGLEVQLGAIPLATWTQVALTCDGSFLRGYVNANLRGIAPVIPNPLTNVSLILGGSADCGARFPGMIDELRVWSVTRDENELRYRTDCTVPPDTSTGLVGYWKFDEPSGSQILHDSSPSCLDGTLGHGIGVEGEDAARVHSSAPLHCSLVSVEPRPAHKPGGEMELGLTYPNPAHGTASMTLALATRAPCSVRVYDVAGAPIRTLMDGIQPQGQQVLHWNGDTDQGRRAAPGVYFIRARAGGTVLSRMLITIR